MTQMLQRWSRSVDSDPHSGRPATSRPPENVEPVRAEISKDWWLTVRELEADLGVPKNYCARYFDTGFGMKGVGAKFILQLLLPEEKERHAAVANDLIQTATNEPDFSISYNGI